MIRSVWAVVAIGGLVGTNAHASDVPSGGMTGKIVLFAAFDRGGPGPKQGLYVVDPATNVWTEMIDVPVKNGIIELFHFRLAPDGRRIAYNLYREKPGQALITTVLSLDLRVGARPRPIGNIDGWPLWGPEGKSLIVVEPIPEADDRGPSRCTTWKIDDEGSHRVRLPIAETDQSLDWSPDGRWLVGKTADGPADLVVQHPDGTERRRVAGGWQPRVSPDSTRVASIARSAERPESMQGQTLRVVNLDGTGRRTIYTEPEDAHLDGVAWSPDGKQILTTLSTWTKIESGTVTPRNPRLCTIDVVDGRVRFLPHPPTTILGHPEWAR